MVIVVYALPPTQQTFPALLLTDEGTGILEAMERPQPVILSLDVRVVHTLKIELIHLDDDIRYR